jgi:hypothetical protein
MARSIEYFRNTESLAKFDGNRKKCQGTTSVVPKERQKTYWVLQAAEKGLDLIQDPENIAQGLKAH